MEVAEVVEVVEDVELVLLLVTMREEEVVEEGLIGAMAASSAAVLQRGYEKMYSTEKNMDSFLISRSEKEKK